MATMTMCTDCEGTGTKTSGKTCPGCDGTGMVIKQDSPPGS